MADVSGEEWAHAALVRLTDKEKLCLRGRLAHQTAKEMAKQWGVSPHAIEKRLKTARAKLGVSSSLEAARLLALSEDYGSPGPQAADLPEAPSPPHGETADAIVTPLHGARRRHALAIGAVLMFLLAALIALALPAPPDKQASTPSRTRKTDMNTAARFLAEGFRSHDRDGSHFLEAEEVSALEPRDSQRDAALPPAPPAGAPDPAASRKWLAKMDTDRDGKVSQEEYVSYMMPWILWQGVPAGWPPRGD